MNDQEIDQYIRDMSQEIFEECEGDMDTAHDLSFERANDNEHVIYYGKAWALVDYFRFYHPDIFCAAHSTLEDMGGLQSCKSLDDAMSFLASNIILDALREALDTLAHQEGVSA